MGMSDVIKMMGGHDGLYYRPYSVTDVKISVGFIPKLMGAWHYVMAKHNAPQNKRFGSLAGSGVFVGNQNKSGIIEIGMLDGTLDAAISDIFNAVDIAFPIAVIDIGTAGTSGIIALACKRVETPEWRRDALPDITTFTFEAHHLEMSWGLRIPEGID
jgi:hypothetical protein